MNEKLKTDITDVLTYFENGLADVEAGSGEKQPQLEEIRSILNRLKTTQPDEIYINAILELVNACEKVVVGGYGCAPSVEYMDNLKLRCEKAIARTEVNLFNELQIAKFHKTMSFENLTGVDSDRAIMILRKKTLQQKLKALLNNSKRPKTSVK